eukprot:14001206-Alexandrium_andersonii.AAC.1
MRNQLWVAGTQPGLLIKGAHMYGIVSANAHRLSPEGLTGRGRGRPSGNIKELSRLGDGEEQASRAADRRGGRGGPGRGAEEVSHARDATGRGPGLLATEELGAGAPRLIKDKAAIAPPTRN